MKNKLLLIIFSIQLLLLNIQACNPGIINTSDSINQQQDTTDIEKTQLISYLEKRVEILENDIIDNSKSDNSFLLSIASWLVAAMSFVLLLAVTTLGFLSYKKFKEATAELEKIKIKNDNIKDDIEIKLEEFEKKSKEIIEIDKKVTGNQTYIDQGLESNFNLFYRYLNRKSDSDFLNLLFEKRAIVNLYSPDEEARFAGITTLYEIGKINCITHLKKIILNDDEIEKNKLLATDAIANIKSKK